MNFTEYDRLNPHRAPRCSFLAFHQMPFIFFANLRLNSLYFRSIHVANSANGRENGVHREHSFIVRMRGNPSGGWNSHDRRHFSSEVVPQGELNDPWVHRSGVDLTKCT